MRGIAATQFFAHGVVRSHPKSSQILCDLHRAFCRGKQVQQQRNLSSCDAGRHFTTEHFLQPYGQYWLIGSVVIDAYVRSARHGVMGWSETVQVASLFLGQE